MPDRSAEDLFRKGSFTADFLGGQTICGWTDGSQWNGWARPYFEFEEACRLTQMHQQINGPRSAWYDPAQDIFGFILQGENTPETYTASPIPTPVGMMKAYPIGTGSWIWEEATP